MHTIHVSSKAMKELSVIRNQKMKDEGRSVTYDEIIRDLLSFDKNGGIKCK